MGGVGRNVNHGFIRLSCWRPAGLPRHHISVSRYWRCTCSFLFATLRCFSTHGGLISRRRGKQTLNAPEATELASPTVMPGGKHDNMKAWSTEEDHTIIDGVQLHGHQWRLIVQDLPGRSVSSTRNRFNRIEKGRKMREEGTRGRNMCHACWQPKKGHICTAKLDGGPHVITQNLVVHSSPLPFIVAQQVAAPHVPGPKELRPVSWSKPPVQKSSSMLSVLGGEDISAIFGEWAKADAAEASGGPAPPPLPPARPPSLPNEQQLEAIAPPALLRMASGEGPTGWVPPKLTRSLSSFFKTLPSDLLQGHLLPGSSFEGGSAVGDALSDVSSSI